MNIELYTVILLYPATSTNTFIDCYQPKIAGLKKKERESIILFLFIKIMHFRFSFECNVCLPKYAFLLFSKRE